MAAFQRELVQRRRWLTGEQYALAFALARITPGTNVLAFCAGAAWLVLGWRGALVAVPAAILPSAALVVALTAAYEHVRSMPLAAGAISGLLAGAVGMMLAAAWNLLQSRLVPGNRLRMAALALAALVLLVALRLSPIPVLALAAAAGALWKAPPGERTPREPS